MDMPEGYNQLKNNAIYLEELEQWKRADRISQALILMKEMAEALELYSKGDVEEYFDNKWHERGTKATQVLDKFKEWK